MKTIIYFVGGQKPVAFLFLKAIRLFQPNTLLNSVLWQCVLHDLFFASGSQSFFLVFMFCSRVKAKADLSLSLSLSFQYKSCTLLPNRETEDMDRHAFKSHQIPCNPPVHTWWWWWSSYAFVHGEWKEEKLAFRQWTSWSMWSAFSWMSKINNPSSSSSSSSSTTLHTHTHSPHTFFTIYSCGLPSSIIMNSRRRRRRRRRRNSSSSSSSRFVCK